MRCGVTTSYPCYINLMDGIEIFSFKNCGILIFRSSIKRKGCAPCRFKRSESLRLKTQKKIILRINYKKKNFK
jgi:hypothetical protein